MDEAADGAARPLRWCRKCSAPVTLEGSGLTGNSEPWLRKAVHTATGREHCADGRLVAPVDEDPALRRQADEIEGEFQVDVSVRFGFFRADRTDICTPVHWEADDAEALRRQLPESLRRAGQPERAGR